MTNSKHYWLMSDGKTVREITSDEWQKLANARRNHFIASVHDCGEIYLRKKRSDTCVTSLFISRLQLDKILNGENTNAVV